MTPMLWRPEFELGRADMDDTHREFVERVNAAAEAADNETFKACFHALYVHTRAHFEHENALMDASRFPAITVHMGEHHRMLGQMDQFNQRVQRGMVKLGREMLAEMPGWFALHAATMDSALAAHLRQVEARGQADPA